jgi:pyruvate formate lyase activating enzyme
VTFSGGEPTASPEFLLECLSLFEGKIHRAVQTCGFCSPEIFADVLANCDYMLFDIKLTDDEKHKKYTGVSNEIILQNFRTLAASGKEFVIRVPLIPTVNDTEENIRQTAELLRDNGIDYVELLPYNKMAGGKYLMLGRTYETDFDGSVEPAVRTELWNDYGIEVKVL